MQSSGIIAACAVTSGGIAEDVMGRAKDTPLRREGSGESLHLQVTCLMEKNVMSTWVLD